MYRLALAVAFTLSTARPSAGQVPAGAPADPTGALPAPTGPFAIGVHRFHWTDSARAELGDSAGRPRAFVVRVWHPTSARGASTAPYLPMLGAYRAAGSISAREVVTFAGVATHATVDAPFPAGRARFPVIVFSPGNGELEHVYTALAEELASHGYVFALVPHPGVSDVAYPDGRVLRRYARLYDPKPRGWDAGIPATASVTLKRALYDSMYTEAARVLLADATFVIDRLAALDAAEGPFAHRLDMSRLATFGHSYGGNVAAEACARDMRVRACMSLDGGSFVQVRDTGLTKPHLLVRPAYVNTGTPRGLAQDQLLGSLRADGYEVNVVGANHRSFMDAHFVDPSTRGDAIDPARVLAIVSAYSRAFLARYLDGAAAPLLDAPKSPFAGVHTRALRTDPALRR